MKVGAAPRGRHPRFAEFDADIALQFSAVQVSSVLGPRSRALPRSPISMPFMLRQVSGANLSDFARIGIPGC